MLVNPTKKNKITLSDYDYKQDIDNRIRMSLFSTFEIDLLQEIVDGSRHTTIAQLAKTITADEEDLESTLRKFEENGLLKLDGKNIEIDKELRKYYERQVEKFDDSFQPGISYLRDLLSKVPIAVLPTWYSIPRMSDNIFASIIERYLQTPKIYQLYLEELELEDTILDSIAADVFNAPNFRIRSRELREKHNLSRAEFEEHMLHLEFNFVCCISYIRVDAMWKEVVTPFHEWRCYLQHLQDSMPQSIEDTDAIERRHPSNFGFIEDLEWIIEKLTSQPCGRAELKKLAQDNSCQEFSQAFDKLTLLEFIVEEKGVLQLSNEAILWSKMTPFDKAISIYRHPANHIRSTGIPKELLTDRNHRLTERALERIVDQEWITFDNFIDSIAEPIGNAEPIMLQRISRGGWGYTIPKLQNVEKELVYRIIFDRLYEVGFIATGSYQGKECFCITPFGKIALCK